MSILKGILHHWNKTTKSYDTIHPETESAQVTDWNQGIVNTLASTGLSSLVNVLSSDSLLALLIKKVFDAAGVKYSTGQNGYVCLGNFFGGVIVQWGTVSNVPVRSYVILPISALPLAVVANDMNAEEYVLILSTSNYQNGKFMIDGVRVSTNSQVQVTNIWGQWIAICK